MAEDKKVNADIEKISIKNGNTEKPADFANEEIKTPDLPKKHEIPVNIDTSKKQEIKEATSFSEGSKREIKGVKPTTSPISNATNQKKIEEIMSKDLEEPYLKLSPDKQIEFKQKGEETATKINVLLSQGKATLKKIVELIRAWLILLPGVNRYFLEQEAKLRADEIIKLKDLSELNKN
jgi:hypothetical protein